MKVYGTEIKDQDIQHIISQLTRPGVRFSYREIVGLFVRQGYKHDMAVAERATDRLLQKLRRRGAIEFRGAGIWESTA